MKELQRYKREVAEHGFSVLENIYSPNEIKKIVDCVDHAAPSNKETFRKSTDLFAIRQFLKEIPEVQVLVFNDKLKEAILALFGKDYFVVKSIYFDKPETSNWYVSYHQDLTISVDKKIDLEGFGPWTTKQNQFAVQPPIDILKTNFTIRIHLDDTNENNGALKVIEKSHLKGIYRPETIDWTVENEKICKIAKGGIMIMKPLTLHGSNRTTNKERRRVIHVEFSNIELPVPLKWAERLNYQVC